MRYTIDEIAQAAGVSKATVSRVINNSATVSPKTKKRVEAVIKKNKYQPNLNAQKLAGGSSQTIALVLEDSTEEIFSNPFWKDVITGFVEITSAAHRHPVLFFHSSRDSDVELVKTLNAGNFDAIAVFGWHRNIKDFEKLLNRNIRLVFGGRQGDSVRFSYVGVNNVDGGILATQHLISKGCKKVLHITGELNIQSARERLQGYRKALQQNKIKFDNNLVAEASYTKKSARVALEKIIASGTKFDSIFAANDLMATEVISVLNENKLRVPRDIKVIGFDGTSLSLDHKPNISTVSQPSRTLGETVATELLSPKDLKLSNIELPLELIQRETTS